MKYKSYQKYIETRNKKLKALELLAKDLPNLQIDDYFDLDETECEGLYIDNIESYKPKIIVADSYVYIYKTFTYKIDNIKYKFVVDPLNHKPINLYTISYNNNQQFIKFKNLHTTLKNKYSKEFIDKIIKKTYPELINVLKTYNMKIVKNSFIPPKLKRVINLI